MDKPDSIHTDSLAYRRLTRILSDKEEGDKNELVKQAFRLLLENRQGEVLPSGKSYIDSVVDVAQLAVSEIGLGRTSIAGFILFRTFSDLSSLGNHSKVFGENVMLIVQGLFNVPELGAAQNVSQAENYRRMLLTMAKDVRVILIKLAEQLELMRQMSELTAEQQLKTALEASFLYAPLAHRLGLYLIKSEMEDLSLKYTEGERYKEIARKLDETMLARKKFISQFIEPVEQRLREQGFDFDIKGRPKTIYSIWNKMKKKGVSFDDIYDLFAIRIILRTDVKNEKADCWQVYSTVTDIYQPNPLRLRDWVSIPKSNGYESLHTTVVGPDGKWVEVQIRTDRMNEIAEKGVAAHWKYKGGSEAHGIDQWLATIRDILESPDQEGSNIIDDFKLSLYSKEVFVFTPKGDLKRFPEGATILDFAYDIHTDVGSTCTGAKVGGKAVPIRYKLQNGDKIVVLTSKTQKPTLDWLNWVVTSRAQKKIRQKINEDQAKDAANGKEIVKRRFKNWKIELTDEIIRDLLKNYKLPNAQEFYYLVAAGKIDPSEIKSFVGRQIETVEVNKLEALEKKKPSHKNDRFEDSLVIDEKMVNIDYKLAPCCSPILGDNIFGFVTISEGIKIHRTNCPNAVQMLGRYGYRVVKAKWTRKGPDSFFPVSIRISGEDQPGILNHISEVISRDSGVNVRNIALNAENGIFEGTVKITVRDIDHLDWLINQLSMVKGVYTVGRVEGASNTPK